MAATYGVILLTWVIVVGGTTGLGLLTCRLIFRGTDPRDLIQGGIWLGLSGFFLTAALAGLFSALTSTAGLVVLSAIILGGWACLIVVSRPLVRPGWRAFRATWGWRRVPTLLTTGLLALAWLLLSRFAAGAPMDGDTGLYRLGAITYAARYGTVPGLANLHDRFGFNTSVSPASALLGNGPWTDQGFRLIAGLCLTALIASTIARLLVPRRVGPSAGDWFAVMGTAFVLALVLTDTGRWVPSPASDLIVAVFGVGAVAFLLDALQRRSVRLTTSAAIATAAAAGSVRPLGWVTAVMIGLVLLFRVGAPDRGRERLRQVASAVVPGTVLAVAFLLVMLARDAILTGWLLYPSTVLALDVPWRTIPGTGTAEWITSWGRAPTADKAVVLASNDWLKPWLTGFWQSRELRLNVYIAFGLVPPLFWRSGRRAWAATLRGVGWALLPMIATGAAWFVTAPDVRFGWLAFTSLVTIPLALLLSHGAYPPEVARIAGVIVLCLMAASNVGNGRITPRGATPVPTTLTWGMLELQVLLGPHTPTALTPVNLHDGTPAWIATENYCWDNVPDCINADPARIYRLGPSVIDGYATLDREAPAAN